MKTKSSKLPEKHTEINTADVIPDVVDVGQRLLDKGEGIVYGGDNGEILYEKPDGTIRVLDPDNDEGEVLI